MSDLQSYFRQFANTLANNLADIADGKDKEKQKKYLLLLASLDSFRAGALSYLLLSVRSGIDQTQQRILSHLAADLHGNAELDDDTKKQIEDATLEDVKKRVLLLLASWRSLGSQLRSGITKAWDRLKGILRRSRSARPTNGGNDNKDNKDTTPADTTGQSPPVDADARSTVAEKLYQVRGSDGKTRSYPPEHYANILTEGANKSASSAVSDKIADNLNCDLVMISPQPSTIGDFCDMYRGKVFSRSGNDPRVYPLSIIPGGTAPMHLCCHHYLIPVLPNQYSDQELRELSQLPADFVELGAKGASTNEFQSLWLSKSREEWLGK